MIAFTDKINALLMSNDVSGLIDALKSHDFTVRREAAVALERIADERSADALMDALRYEEWQKDYPILAGVRAAAARALGKIGNPSAVKPLLRALEDPDDEVKIGAMRSLSEFPSEESLRAIEKFVDHPSEDIRRNSIESIAGLDPELGLRYASRALGDSSWMVRKTAAKVIRRFGDKRCLEVLLDNLNDPDTEVRRHILLAVVNMGEYAVDPLLEKLSDPQWQTRAMVVEALGEIGSRRAVPMLKGMLAGRRRDENRYVRGKVAEALGRIGDPAALEDLHMALRDPYLFVRRKAREAIDIIDVEPDLEEFHDGEISFRYPRFWNIFETRDGERLIDAWSDNLKIAIKRRRAEGLTADEFSEIILEVLNMRGLFNIARSNITVDSEHGYMITADTKNERVVTFIFKKGGYIYYIYFRGPIEDLKESYKYIRVFINTLHVEIQGYGERGDG